MTATFAPATTAFAELKPHVLRASSEALAALLEKNHASHHCFFNHRGMHNHSAHQLIADLTLCATASQLEQHYEYQIGHYLGSFSLNERRKYDPYVADTSGSDRGAKEIEKITDANWSHHLGNARYYWSYLHFFDAEVERLGFRQVLERYVLSAEANQEGRRMVVRFYGGVLHALIHFGYAIELGTAGLAAEGLAMATATTASHKWLFPYQWLKTSPPSDSSSQVGLLELFKEIQHDPRLSAQALKLEEQDSALPDAPFESPDEAAYGVIHEYVDRWAPLCCGASGRVDESAAMAELSLLSALLLGAVPKTNDGYYRHDFFLMHLNNAHLFTRLYMDLVHDCVQLKRMYLRAFLAQTVYYYVARGRPCFSASNWHDQLKASNRLDWQTMFNVCTAGVDEHLPKAVRALYVYHQQYAPLQAKLWSSGILPDSNHQLDEDESVFKLTAAQMVRMHTGQLKPSKYTSDTERDKGERVGAHQEFWSFDAFL